MYQKLTIIGNLGRDPELKTLQSGTTICSFSVAVTEKVKKNNDWIDETTWIKVVTFAKSAENCAKYLAKGSSVFVEGRLKLEEYVNKSGENKATLSLVADNVKFLSKAHKQEQSGFEGYADASSLVDKTNAENARLAKQAEDDNIPF